MRIAVAFLMLSLVAAVPAHAGCPAKPQPLPSPLTSAHFSVPAGNDTILFSAAPSFSRISYAVRISRRGDGSAGGTVVRLKSRMECNIHDAEVSWPIRLNRNETRDFYARMAEIEAQWRPSDTIGVDGTSFEYRHYRKGAWASLSLSNGPDGQTGRLVTSLLELLRNHVPPRELPPNAEWRYAEPAYSSGEGR